MKGGLHANETTSVQPVPIWGQIDAMVALRYTRVAVILHWLVAVLITVNVVLALWADHVPDDSVRAVIDAHKSIGISVLGLALLRILWRLTHRPPVAPAVRRRSERIAAQVVHGGLYLLILLLPLSGWLHDSAWKDAATHPMHWFGLFEWPRIGAITALPPTTREALHTRFGELHTASSYLLYALLALHIAGALKHQWLDGEPSLQRMTLRQARPADHGLSPSVRAGKQSPSAPRRRPSSEASSMRMRTPSEPD